MSETPGRRVFLPESFIRNHRLTPEAFQLYCIYSLMAEYSREQNWVNKNDEAYIHVTVEMLGRKFGFYALDIQELHHELTGQNLIQSRDSVKEVGEYCLLVRPPKICTPDTYDPIMPRAVKKSKRILMYQWREFLRHMTMTYCKRMHPLALHIYLDVLLPCGIAQQTAGDLRKEDISGYTFLGVLGPGSIQKILTSLEIVVSKAQLKKMMKRLETNKLVELVKITPEGIPLAKVQADGYSKAWSDKPPRDEKFAYLILNPPGGKKDYSVFLTEPDEYLKLIEKISKNVPLF